MMHWFRSLSELRQGLVVYGTVLLTWLLLFELPSKDILGWAPWPSTTLTVRDAIKWWHPVAGMVLLLLFVLFGHFDKEWRVRYLVATVIAIIAAVAIHAAP